MLDSTLSAHEPGLYDEVVMEVVNNPNTPADVLRNLAHHSGHNVRWAVARHSNTPEEVLIMLSEAGTGTVVRLDAMKNLTGRRR